MRTIVWCFLKVVVRCIRRSWPELTSSLGRVFSWMPTSPAECLQSCKSRPLESCERLHSIPLGSLGWPHFALRMSAEKAGEAGAQKALEEVSACDSQILELDLLRFLSFHGCEILTQEMEQLKQRMKAALFDADPSAVLQALELLRSTKHFCEPL